MSSKLRVLHSLPTWLPNTSPWLYNQVRFLPRDRIDPTIVAGQRGAEGVFSLGIESYLEDQFRLRQLTERALRNFGMVRQYPFFHQIARKLRPHILHSHWGDHGWRDAGIARGLNIPHVVTFYGKDVGYLPKQDPAWRARYREMFDNAALVTCEGPFMAERIIELGCPRSKVHTQRLGVVVKDIHFETRKRAEGAPLRILMAASFREKKGLPYALDAIGLARDAIGPVEVTIIGDASADPRSLPEKQAILASIEQHNLRPNVTMLGYQPYQRLMEEAYRHHIFMSPSVTARDGDTEGGAPIALIDMAATGILILSSTHCDIPQSIVHDETGLLAPERDSAALAALLRRLVAEPDIWDRLSKAGRHRVETMFDAETQSRALAERYEGLVHARSTAERA